MLEHGSFSTWTNEGQDEVADGWQMRLPTMARGLPAVHQTTDRLVFSGLGAQVGGPGLVD